MPAPSSKERKVAIGRTPIEIKRIGFINKRRPGHSGDNRKGAEMFNKPDMELRRLK